MSSVERKGSNDPAPRACISMGAKAINTKRGIAPTTIPPINRQLQAAEPFSKMLQLKTAILAWKELSLAVFLVEPWEAFSPKKTTGSGRFLLGLSAALLSDVRSMASEPPSNANRKLVRKTSRSCANQCRADSPRCSKQRSPQDQPRQQERGVGPANRD